MSFTHQQLRSFVDRVCLLNEEIKTLNSDKSEVYKEARANGFNPKILKAAVKRFEQLKTDRHGVEEFDALLEIYMEALLGSGVPNDQGDDETPSPLNSGPAKGIVEAPTRACAHEAARTNSWSRESEREFLASLDDGGIASPDPDLAPLPLHDGETGELIEEPDAQHEATVETTSPMPEASPSPASQEPRSRGSGAVA